MLDILCKIKTSLHLKNSLLVFHFISLDGNAFPERFFGAVFACHADEGFAQTFRHRRKSSSMATALFGDYKQFLAFSF